MTREDCKTLWIESEYDFENPTEELRPGHSVEKADEWFNDIQARQGEQNVRLGIFLNDASVIGEIALQNIDRVNRKCSVGMGIAKISNLRLMLAYGLEYLGLERIYANTLAVNAGGRGNPLKNAASRWRGQSGNLFT